MAMELVVERCAGIDVHQTQLRVCVRVPGVNNGEGIPTRACGAASGGAGSAWMPGTAGCWLTEHADASDPSDDPSPREPVRRLEQREDHAALLEAPCSRSTGSRRQGLLELRLLER